jgi:diadenosine tetraphosphate (Ap4A) HIT family hydrolase
MSTGKLKPVKSGCPFCLDNGLLATKIIASTDTAFVTNTQTREGTYLIVPSDHVEDVAQLPDDWWTDVKQLLHQLPELGDYNLSVNVGEQAGQRLKHLHFWVIPRQANMPSSGKGMAALIAEVDDTA